MNEVTKVCRMIQRYNEYKDSGVQWLGEIPSHWELVPLKYCMILNNGRDYKEYESNDGIPVIGTGGQFAYSNKEMFNGEVVFFGRKGTIDKPFHYKGAFWAVDTVFYAEAKSNMICRYLYYLGTTIPFGLYSTSTAIPSMTQTDLLNNPISLPPLPEQQAIASYLDTATSNIDAAIAQQQKMIDLLNERKQIIINNAVTKGLNPNVKMKDSGVDWIGEIPEHWIVIKTLYALSMPITDGPHETPVLYDSGIPFISAEAVSGGFIDFSHMRGYVSEAFYKECCKKYIPQLHDVYMIKSGATTGRTAIVETNEVFTIWSPLAVFRANTKVINPYFLLNALRSVYYTKQVELNWSYGTQQNIGMRILEKLLLCVPPVQEQEEIIKHIASSIIPIDKTIENCKIQISLLQERKQIIINEVVTGKVKVTK